MALFSLLCVLALPCTFAYPYCTMPIMPCPAFCPRPALLLLCPLLICPPALPCPAMSSPALSSKALSSPALPANSPISGRSDRKVLRLIKDLARAPEIVPSIFYFFYFFDFFLIFSIFFARTVYITIQSDRVYIDIYI